jgi:Holliday junction resolvase RusA-like endonuclease
VITFRIDIEPKGWARGTPWKGRVLTPADQRAYQKRLKDEARLAMNGQPVMEGPVHVHLTAFMPTPKSIPAERRGRPTTKPDADNILKNALDAFNGVIWRDDVQIVEATVLKQYSSSPALVVVARAA